MLFLNYLLHNFHLSARFMSNCIIQRRFVLSRLYNNSKWNINIIRQTFCPKFPFWGYFSSYTNCAIFYGLIQKVHVFTPLVEHKQFWQFNVVALTGIQTPIFSTQNQCSATKLLPWPRQCLLINKTKICQIIS